MNWKEIALKAVRESILIRLPKNERETLEAVFEALAREEAIDKLKTINAKLLALKSSQIPPLERNPTIPFTHGTYGNQGALLHIDTTQTINETQEDEPKEDFVEKFGEELKHPHDEPIDKGLKEWVPPFDPTLEETSTPTKRSYRKRGSTERPVCRICGEPGDEYLLFGKTKYRYLCKEHHKQACKEYALKRKEKLGKPLVNTVEESKPDADINGAYETLRQAYLRHGHIPGVVSYNVAKKFGMNSGEVKLLAAEAVAGR